MATETQYGYKIPEVEDKDFFDSYNYNYNRLDTHTHDGVDSAPIITNDESIIAASPAGTDGELRYNKIADNSCELWIYSSTLSEWLKVSL